MLPHRCNAQLIRRKKYDQRLFPQLIPQRDNPCPPGLIHIDDPLIAAAAELEGNIFQFFAESSINQNINAGKHVIRCLTAGMAALTQQLIIQPKAGEAPNCLTGILLPHFPQQRQQGALVFRLKRFSAEQRKALYISRLQCR